MTAFNHERFIGQAIESVLMQQTDFDFELVIGEDCSTDHTREVIGTYAQAHPDRIRLLLREKNLGMIPNFVSTLESCRGRYVAICEGDDFWTNPDKLQKQVDLLDAHPEFSICFHTVEMFQEDESRPPKYKPEIERDPVLGLEDLLTGNIMHSSSVMFRNGLIEHFPAWYYDLPFPDWPLFIFCAEHGQIGFMNEVMSAHRLHDSGSWSTKSDIDKLTNTIAVYQHINEYLNYAYKEIINPHIYKYSVVMLKKYTNQGELELAKDYWKKCIKLSPFTFVSQGKEFLWLTARVYTPGVYGAYKRKLA